MTDSKMPELLPCPFCGGAARYQLACGIICTGCAAGIPCRGDDFGPWNIRADLAHPAPVADAELEASIASLQELVSCRCDPAYKDRGLHDPQCNCDYTVEVETLLTALRARTAQPVGVRVKPLAWKLDDERPEDFPRWEADTDLGKTYHVFKAWWGAQDRWGFVGIDGFYHTEDAAKSAAQADYEQRILSALLPEGGTHG